ncbi:MAG: type II toxin-antitoxin system HicA family toxin [Desulfobacteraceae bacterium]|nr:type II toxin-antitoxin system HicA family toxin [Desulfobacteraceae bacterium]
MPNRSPLSLKDFIKKLKKFGVIPMARTRGKGSEIILLKPSEKDPKSGPQYPIKNHGKKTEIHVPVIKAALRRFQINEDDFWK